MTKRLTDISYIKQLCAKYGFSLTKKFGQNFIVNANLCPSIAASAGVEGAGVIEIGPGFGVLTRELSTLAAKVVAIELDTRLPAVLAQTLEGCDNVEVVQGDALTIDLAALAAQKLAGLPLFVCANLPYYITSPMVMKLLESGLQFESATLMVQKEAADRLCAGEAKREVGAISLAVHYYATTERLFNVNPGSFFPPPKVVSSVIKVTRRAVPLVQPKDEKRMFAVIKAAFSQRRKTAVNAVSAGLTIEKARVASAFEQLNIKADIRPEMMTLEQFAALADFLFA